MKKILALLCLITMINYIHNTVCTDLPNSRRNIRILQDLTDDDCKGVKQEMKINNVL